MVPRSPPGVLSWKLPEAAGVGRHWGQLGSGFMGACWEFGAKDGIWDCQSCLRSLEPKGTRVSGGLGLQEPARSNIQLWELAWCWDGFSLGFGVKLGTHFTPLPWGRCLSPH